MLIPPLHSGIKIKYTVTHAFNWLNLIDNKPIATHNPSLYLRSNQNYLYLIFPMIFQTFLFTTIELKMIFVSLSLEHCFCLQKFQNRHCVWVDVYISFDYHLNFRWWHTESQQRPNDPISVSPNSYPLNQRIRWQAINGCLHISHVIML